LSKRSLNGTELASMIFAGAERLSRNVDRVNALNVFPVPDGDTGTNMNLTMTAGVAELSHKPSEEVGKAAEALSKGLLMGARGNSGVILSQLFRGFSRAISGLKELNVASFANALQQGVDTAYKAVVKPVEGTILTVAKEAARHGLLASRRTSDVTEWMREVHAKAVETLARTQDMLPILKQVGVVDSGGQGLVCIYEGFVQYLSDERSESASPNVHRSPAAPTISALDLAAAANATAQSKIATDSIIFPYDMEFFIQLIPTAVPYSELDFRKALEQDGDSIILIEDDSVVKVHVHSRRPGDVFNAAIIYGEITHMHLLNMREQHRDLLHAAPSSPVPEAPHLDYSLPGVGSLPGLAASPETVPNVDVYELASFGVVAVSVGDGNAELFGSLGVDIVLSGGQSMNPSTEDLLGAVRSLTAEHVFILPNNPNIIMAAKQAAELADRPVTVLPTRTIPQGMAAMLAFQEHESAEANAERMTKACESVISGAVTKAVRDTTLDGVDIREGHYIGIKDKAIVVSAPSLEEANRELAARMLSSGGEVITILSGEGASLEETEKLTDWLSEQYPDVEIEVHEGGQPLYPYLFAVEP
jgi:uncharacterized protein